jgi:AcrR family transcriptional regulator
VAGRRMTRENRRIQLLDTAAALVRAEGTDALTLARVAEEAGVTKPVAYEHFENRSGLLKALYRRIDEQQTEAVSAALAAGASSLPEAVGMLAEAYVDCALHIGMEYGPVTAALSTSPDFEDILRDGHERYAALFVGVLGRFVELPADGGRAVMLGAIGAAETLARETIAGRLDRAAAIDAIVRIIIGAVQYSG